MGKSKANPSIARAGPSKHSSQARKLAPPVPDHHIDTAQLLLQQKCLNVFRDAFRPDAESSELLQEVKGHLYNRDFAAAFSKAEYLAAYASRWSPSRALAYLSIFGGLPLRSTTEDEKKEHGLLGQYRVVGLGGGAGAEVVALAAWFSTCIPDDLEHHLSLDMVDVANWADVVTVLSNRVTTLPEVSKYASEAVKAANVAMLNPDHIDTRFVQQDVLDWSEVEIKKLVGDASLVTILFTLNELYSSSIGKTQNLLAQLSRSMRKSSLLLVVDSPGSYSTVSIGGADKKYPMQWLLDLALMGPPAKHGSEVSPTRWEQILTDDSRWFRLPSTLQYPIELENMRYQIHLYRKTDGTASE